MKPLTTTGTILLLAASLTINSLPGLACGPFFKTAVFNYEINPGLPLSKFSEGSLGVIRPSFARSYLVVAYRYLSEKPLAKLEQKVALDLWKTRLTFDDYVNINTSVDEWKKARAKVVDSKINVNPYGKLGKYSSYLCINKAAFSTAIESLDKMIAKYGIKSKEVSEWLKAQDKVFAHREDKLNKDSKNQKTVKVDVLEAMPDSASEFEKNERQYQIAAYYFYRKKFDTAIEKFEEISKNKKSRWNKLASYLVARSYIRKAQLEKNIDKNVVYGRAKEKLKNILADKTMSTLHSMSRSLLQYVTIRSEPRETLNLISKRIADGKSPGTFKNDLTDLTFLLDEVEVNQSSDEKGKDKIAPPIFQFDLAEWIWKFQASNKKDLGQVISKWRETKSLPWLISSMSLACKATSNLSKKDFADILKAANSVEQSSPGYYSVAYYKSKLLLEKGDIERAGKTIDLVLAKRIELSPSTINLFKDLKLEQISSIDQLIALIPRRVAGDDFAEYDMPDWFFSDKNNKVKRPDILSIAPLTAQLLNTALPVNALVKIAESKNLPVEIQKNLVPALWLRAVLLNKEKQALILSSRVGELIPVMKSDLLKYRSCKNSKQRKFLALYIALRNPGLRPYVESGYAREEKIDHIDSYRNNWWGKGKVEYYYDSRGQVKANAVSNIAKRILDDSQIIQAKNEYNTLLKLGTAPNYLANEIIAYSKINPGDSRIPEALHRAVKATRYGSTDDQTTVLSKACFKLLHKRYQKSSWTKKTPYHY